MNINKEKTPKTIQLSKKFTAAIERKDIKNRMRRTALTIFPKLTISKNTKESNPMNPKILRNHSSLRLNWKCCSGIC